MKVLKWVLIVLGSLIAIFLIYSASQSNQLNVEESITINAPADKIFYEISHFENWMEWSVWSKLDAEMEQEFSETMGEVGSYSEWKSDHPRVGNGRQEVVEIRQNEYQKVAMQFEGMEGTAYAAFILEPSDDGVLVRWTFEGAETPFYMNWINGLIEPELRKNYVAGLEALKVYVEGMADDVQLPAGTSIEEMEAQMIISIVDSTTGEGISAKLTEMYTELSIFVESNQDLNMAGMPLAIYHDYAPERVIMEGAFTVQGSAESAGRVKVGELPQGTVIKGIHYGDYAASEDLHNAIYGYIEASDYEMAGSPWEVYANDPTMVDSADVETHIFYPIAK